MIAYVLRVFVRAVRSEPTAGGSCGQVLWRKEKRGVCGGQGVLDNGSTKGDNAFVE